MAAADSSRSIMAVRSLRRWCGTRAVHGAIAPHRRIAVQPAVPVGAAALLLRESSACCCSHASPCCSDDPGPLLPQLPLQLVQLLPPGLRATTPAGCCSAAASNTVRACWDPSGSGSSSTPGSPTPPRCAKPRPQRRTGHGARALGSVAQASRL
jgi:hypothetical protein